MNKIIGISATCLLSFATSAQTIIYSEDFQGGIPVDYTIINYDNLTPNAAVAEFTDAWIVKEDPDNPGDTVAASTSYFEPAGTADRWLITPQITLGAYGNFLYWEAKSHDASYPDGYQVLISTTDTQAASFDTLHTVLLEIDTWNARSLDLNDSAYLNQTVYIAFANRTNDGFKLYIDDISVVIEDPVGIDEQLMDDVTIYPNPFSDQITIQVQNFQSVELLNIEGQIISTSTDNKLYLSDLPSGSYLVRVYTDSQVLYRKVSKN